MSARHAPQTSTAVRAAGGAWRKMRGITLIELMTVVAVVAILGTIAVSSYRSYLLRTNRTEARMALLRVQAAQEKFFLQNNRYATAAELDDAPPNGLGIPAITPGGYYAIDLQNVTGTTYTARARAAAGQLADAAACQTLTIDHTGARTPNDASGCWR
ncbi:MAG TPA: type IV pilin protein [Steroidobacter sp.]|nr:type IV pilin protein [Steroidobacter sp.]